MKSKTISLCGLFAALAVAISFAESLSGINSLIPVPGVKLGLANIAILGACIFMGRRYAAAVLVIRLAVTFFTFGNATGFFISAFGGGLALLSVCATVGLRGKCISTVGISALSAFCHALGQLTAVALISGVSAVISLSAVILAMSTVTGVISGICAEAVFSAGERSLTSRRSST